MKKSIAFLLALILCLGTMVGCASKPEGGASSDGEPVTITIWHDGDEAIMQTIADQVNAQLAEDNITVAFEKKTGMLTLYRRN